MLTVIVGLVSMLKFLRIHLPVLTVGNIFHNLTLLRPGGLLIKYPQFPDVLNTLNVQPHNIFLLAF